MQPTGSTDLDNCPVSDDLLKRLLDATFNAVTDVGNQLPDGQRAALAVYCYRRAHFRKLGLSLAKLCSRQSLLMEAGHAGEMIHLQSAATGTETESRFSGVSRGGKAQVSLRSV
ncbi:hypothetical protein [Roseibium marinum]|uniref:Uncharacterized protein n=1 Tax=Roseibium marinum TaxID=281252 RepID=A0A2S3V3X9_9HYPH|nr:hypothetical protein [Roseibium marinum]POF34692.1 hypothetical protein CLV41_1011150 [Roseibium marinum]